MNNMNGAGQPAGQRGLLNRAVALASTNLVLFAILTVVNMVLITANADISFSFSAEIPPILLVYGVSALKETGSAAIASVFFVLAVVSVGFIFLCAVLSKKKTGMADRGADIYGYRPAPCTCGLCAVCCCRGDVAGGYRYPACLPHLDALLYLQLSLNYPLHLQKVNSQQS